MGPACEPQPGQYIPWILIILKQFPNTAKTIGLYDMVNK